MQNHFLYFPSPNPPSAGDLSAEGLTLWQQTSSDYRGLIATREGLPPNGTIVLFHGNGGTALDRTFYLSPLGSLGFRVILAEYPKYGGRPGQVGEKPFVADGLETVRLAYEHYGEPLYLLGESLGCGVAAAVSKQATNPIAGIILITPWDTLVAVAKSLFPFLPVSWLLTDKYDSIGNLQSFKGNISVVGAERDEILPVQHAQNLYQSLPEGKKRMWVIKGAGHNDWPAYAEPSLWKEMTDFVKIGK
ncbi:MAG: alpha/beta fold hydrolase [Thermodesulfobacteriota bacterium]